MLPTRSLRLRLLILIVVPLMLISTVAVYWRFEVARNTARDIFDRNLVMLCLAVSRDVANSGGDTLSETTLNLFRGATKGDIYYHVYGPDGSFVTGYSSPPVSPKDAKDTLNAPVLFDAKHLGRPIRAARLAEHVNFDGLVGTSVVTVWQSTEPRRDFALRMARQTALITALLMTAVSGLVFFGIKFGLRPLRDLEDAIIKRSHADLSPIARPVPDEAYGIVSRLNSLFARLTEANEAKDRLISNAAHQLRNPIAAVHSLASATLNAPSFEESKERAQSLLEETRRTVRITEQMLSIERLDGLAFKPERGEMISFLKDNAAVMALKSLSRDVVFEFSSNVSAVTVDYDPILMQEALTNIFENALAHGGDDLKNIIFQVDASTSNVTIKISNDGQPITSITRTKIFDRFAQGQESQGAGLGLAIVDEIMSLHEGTVELVHNDPVSFNLTLNR